MPIKNAGSRAAAMLLLAGCGAAFSAETDPAEDPCNFHSSIALLERGVYSAHTYTERENDNATEAAELATGVRIEIVSSGCVDSSARAVAQVKVTS